MYYLCFFAIFKYAIMRTISLHPNDHTVLEKATQIIRILFDTEILHFFGQSPLQESLCKNHTVFGNRNIFFRQMRVTNVTVSKAFLSEGVKEK